ncbi:MULTISPECIES: dynamin family protein [unclassified Tolypothrix]|uniref:dynamin family protein n=1 Tax=unclassified Tolypothrix TaxID=2649714 RepID=UPI0005EAADF1|nr:MULTISPECIES: dynamin family protein [unclassified Tolypothrix]BAY89539.1 hypothetical protein NIES3275_15420 [Microchaete diplosiphon NIES-3275]EKF02511.1 hypothetical protein FDUTEX481_06674 [Tolypothrix sp. PCC 7601]MBE9081569.1 dynamin family protein [Tolypothrix sp. LEGE 11397]UYD23822.1 dynamin family protein [Tolypothrix sp. PCC 7712]UYD33953.1 dynamin family protein [Tolypothrix sp. PCC 7601]
MADIQKQISQVINKRREQLPRIEVRIKQAEEVEKGLKELNNALADLANHPKATDELQVYIRDFQKHQFSQWITSSIDQLIIAKARLLRETINIGVSGQARVGKSTLLQTIAGLTDEQVPTGSGIPVTAVRSRLRHSTTHSRAILTLHTFETFREQILEPYHKELKLSSCPITLADFQSFNYSQPNILGDNSPHSSIVLLERLRKMQKALPSYSNYLTGETKEVSLQGLRSWVAYPTNEEEKNPNCPRLYLAVRDVLIECSFKATDVENLTIIDLPGLGELDASAEEHHVAGLKNEVDLVLLVKRPVEGLAFWKAEDGKAANILDLARGAIKQRRDFVILVVNGDASSQLLQVLLDDITRQANEGIPDKHYKVLQCNATDSSSVRDSLLKPCLEHLAERLTIMDQEVIESAKSEWLTTIQRIQGVLEDLRKGLKSQTPNSVASPELFDELVGKLRENIAVSLKEEVVQELFQQARNSEEEDTKLIETIRFIDKQINQWVEDEGFGIGKEQWISKAYKKIQLDTSEAKFAVDELNRIRVEISERYCQIDDYLDTKVEDLWAKISYIIRKHTGQLLEATQDSRESLEKLAELLKNGSEFCPNLQKAVDELLSLNISYRTHFHPRVRKQLDSLNFNALQHILVTKYKFGEEKKYSEELFKRMSELAIQASDKTKKALVSETLTPVLILHAAAEQFEDSLIRSGESEKEFKRLGRSYRDEIWPSTFSNIDAENAKVTKVHRAIDMLEKTVRSFN